MIQSNLYPKTLAGLTLGTIFLSGCFFEGDKITSTKTDKPVKIAACQDLAPTQMKTADSLVALGTAKMTADMEYMFSDSVNAWADVKARNPRAALNLYDQALVVAPGHCGATFGRAVASAMMLNQDPKLDAFVVKAEASTNGNNPVKKMGSGRALLKLSPDQAAPALLKLSANMDNIDLPTVTEFQALVESSLMPKLDSTIGALEEALKFEGFTFEFTTEDGQVHQLDHGEIGPMLAGLKVAKAWLTIAAGYQWEITVNGKYTWFDSIQAIKMADYDHLRPGQVAALDQVTGLFKTGSSFSKIRPAWKARVNGIPTLLLEAVNDAQKGLRYAISEAAKTTGQEHDIYVVGTGLDADVDPVDLQEAVDLLERAKKYLTGAETITYNKGIRSLKINFPKLFEIDGMQKLLPYFQFLPYAEWNDTISADTNWAPYLGYEAENDLLSKMGYNRQDDYGISINRIMTSSAGSFEVILRGHFLDTGVIGPVIDTVLGEAVSVPGKPCSYTYTKKFNRVLDPGAKPANSDIYQNFVSPYHSVATTATGSFTLGGCRENMGDVEYVQYMNVKTKGPFYFTTPAGVKTLDLLELTKYDNDIPALETKIFFRDPTFGGIFPELTQATIWSTIKSLENVQPREQRVCTDEIGPDGFLIQTCHYNKVKNPSDLDALISITHWMDAPL
jgi:hypothetical protein